MRVTCCLCCTVKKKKSSEVSGNGTELASLPVLFLYHSNTSLHFGKTHTFHTTSKIIFIYLFFLLENARADKMSQVGWEWKVRISYCKSKTCMKLKLGIKRSVITCAFNCAEHLLLQDSVFRSRLVFCIEYKGTASKLMFVYESKPTGKEEECVCLERAGQV